MATREVVIAGKKTDLIAMLNSALSQLEEGDATLWVQPNVERDPELELRFTTEDAEDWDEPLVEYEERAE